MKLFKIFFIIFFVLFNVMGCDVEDKPQESSVALSRELPSRGLCAHRGGVNNTHPENTIAAFKQAIALGSQMIEFDVRRTKDNELIVMHDTSVDRTTNGSGNICDLTLAELKKLDAGSWKSEEFKGERIPTLQEALAIMPRNVWLNVHIKDGENIGATVAKVIMETDRLHQAVLACGQKSAKAAREVAPEIMICNMQRKPNQWEYVNDTIAMKAAFIQLKGEITPEFVDYAEKLHKHGIRVNYFGTDDRETLFKLFAMNIDFPLVNTLNKMMPAAQEIGIKPNLQPK